MYAGAFNPLTPHARIECYLMAEEVMGLVPNPCTTSDAWRHYLRDVVKLERDMIQAELVQWQVSKTEGER